METNKVSIPHSQKRRAAGLTVVSLIFRVHRKLGQLQTCQPWYCLASRKGEIIRWRQSARLFCHHFPFSSQPSITKSGPGERLTIYQTHSHLPYNWSQTRHIQSQARSVQSPLPNQLHSPKTTIPQTEISTGEVADLQVSGTSKTSSCPLACFHIPTPAFPLTVICSELIPLYAAQTGAPHRLATVTFRA